MTSFVVCNPQQILFRRSIMEEIGEASGTHWEEQRWFRVLVGDLLKRNHLEHRGLDGSIILKWMFKKWD